MKEDFDINAVMTVIGIKNKAMLLNIPVDLLLLSFEFHVLMSVSSSSGVRRSTSKVARPSLLRA
ncbi:MAG TPA: hypothetical protein VE244_06940 [Nitrososphaeraceae archaeon]|nr:hypothetical protein [Nitrososphaeraceae archaeon]